MVSRLWIPAIHLPHGRELLRPFPYRPSHFKRILKQYAERFLLLCEPQDAIVLPKMPEANYLEFLLTLGMGSENIIVCEGSADNFASDILADKKTLSELCRRAESVFSSSFYIHLEEEREIAIRLGREDVVMHPALTRMFNSIYFLIRLEEELEIDAIKRHQIRSSRFTEAVLPLLEKEGALFVRGNESIGGSQVYLLKTRADIEKTHKKVCRNRQITRYFASKLLEPSDSWNVQFELTQNGVTLLGASRQLLENHAHKGNLGGGLAGDDTLGTARRVVKRLWEMGAAGTIGIDMIVDSGKTYAVEINARHNTSTPLIHALRKLSGKESGKGLQFHSFSIDVARDFSFQSFTDLVGRENLLTPGDKTGLLPYHFAACPLSGKLEVAAFAGNETELTRLVRLASAPAV